MSNKGIDHKQLIVAKCYELALFDCKHEKYNAHVHGIDYPSHKIDERAMHYLDNIIKAAHEWKRAEDA